MAVAIGDGGPQIEEIDDDDDIEDETILERIEVSSVEIWSCNEKAFLSLPSLCLSLSCFSFSGLIRNVSGKSKKCLYQMPQLVHFDIFGCMEQRKKSGTY